MKNQITFRECLSVFFGGFWRFIRNIFSWKNKTPFWRVIWATITVCIVMFTSTTIYCVYRKFKEDDSWLYGEAISNRMNFSRYELRKAPGMITDRMSGAIITEDVDWVIVSEDEDSLAVFSSKGKRGYLNRYSGKVAIAPQYDKAWIFSSGVAAVAKGDKVLFIDHSGKPINDKTFTCKPRNSYVYHGDYCAMNDENDMLGLIDRDGNWKVEPKYDLVCRGPHNYWKMRQCDDEAGLWYAFTDKAEPVNETGVKGLEISEDLGVIYTLPNHLKMVIDFEGNRMERFLCQDIDALYYETDQRDSTNSFIPARCTLYRYRMDDGYEGLCTATGDIVTEPLYWNVQPVGKDLYHCTYRNSDLGVLINSKGEITKL